MRLSDIMGQMGLWGWAVAAMVLFLAVYASQVWWIWTPGNRELMARGGELPLQDDLIERGDPAAVAPNGASQTEA